MVGLETVNSRLDVAFLSLPLGIGRKEGRGERVYEDSNNLKVILLRSYIR